MSHKEAPQDATQGRTDRPCVKANIFDFECDFGGSEFALVVHHFRSAKQEGHFGSDHACVAKRITNSTTNRRERGTDTKQCKIRHADQTEVSLPSIARRQFSMVLEHAEHVMPPTAKNCFLVERAGTATSRSLAPIMRAVQSSSDSLWSLKLKSGESATFISVSIFLAEANWRRDETVACKSSCR